MLHWVVEVLNYNGLNCFARLNMTNMQQMCLQFVSFQCVWTSEPNVYFYLINGPARPKHGGLWRPYVVVPESVLIVFKYFIEHIWLVSCPKMCYYSQHTGAFLPGIWGLWFMISFKLQFGDIDLTNQKETHCLTHVCRKNHNHNQKVNTVIHVTLVTASGFKHLCPTKLE